MMRVLSLGFVAALLAALIVTLWPTGGGPVMPELTGKPVPGVFLQIEGGDFDTWHPANPAYEPSARIAVQARWHVSLDGPVPRLWHEFVPEERASMPLVILLHGANRNGLSVIEMWEQTARRHGLALLAPDARGGLWPLEKPETAFLTGLVAEMAARHDIDPERIYLFGHSDGAAYAQILLNRTRGPWRAAALHAGFIPPGLLRPPAEALPLRLYLGDRDGIFGVGAAQDALGAMAAMGHEAELVLIPGHTHWFYQIGPQIAEDSWQWLGGMK